MQLSQGNDKLYSPGRSNGPSDCGSGSGGDSEREKRSVGIGVGGGVKVSEGDCIVICEFKFIFSISTVLVTSISPAKLSSKQLTSQHISSRSGAEREWGDVVPVVCFLCGMRESEHGFEIWKLGFS